MEDSKATKSHRLIEEIEIAGDQLVLKVKQLIKEGNIRRLVIRNSEGKVLMEVPLSAGLAVGGVTTLFAPVIVALGAMAGLVACFKVEVVRKPDNEIKAIDSSKEDFSKANCS